MEARQDTLVGPERKAIRSLRLRLRSGLRQSGTGHPGKSGYYGVASASIGIVGQDSPFGTEQADSSGTKGSSGSSRRCHSLGFFPRPPEAITCIYVQSTQREGGRTVMVKNGSVCWSSSSSPSVSR